MDRRSFGLGIAQLLLIVACAVGSVPALVSAAVVPRPFTVDQLQLERQLATRASQLARLGFDVTHSATLSAQHVATMDAKLRSALANIEALSGKVRLDSTLAELRADRIAMLDENRVFAVLTPQVLLTINADATFAQIANFHAGEGALRTSVTSLAGQSSYENARRHLLELVHEVEEASAGAGRALAEVLAQTPAGFPHNTKVFVTANRRLLAADLALAHASYDEAVIGLATGGYKGA